MTLVFITGMLDYGKAKLPFGSFTAWLSLLIHSFDYAPGDGNIAWFLFTRQATLAFLFYLQDCNETRFMFSLYFSDDVAFDYSFDTRDDASFHYMLVRLR